MELEPGPCICVLCVTYVIMGLIMSDTTLCLGGLVGLLVLRLWTTNEKAVKRIVEKSDPVTSNTITRPMRKDSQSDVVTLSSDLMTSVNPVRRK